MGAKRGSQPDPFADVHRVSPYIERRLRELRSEGSIGSGVQLARAERDAILEFVRARQSEVSPVRVRTFLAWLPQAANRLGPRFLDPDRDTPSAFVEAFPPSEYKRGTRATGANCLGAFWRWWLVRQGKEFPSWLHIRLEKWKPTNGPSDMLTREDVAMIADQAQNFRDRAWIWALFNSGCRPGEIYRLRVGDVVPNDAGYIELRVLREKGSAPEPAPVYEDAVPALHAWLSAHPLREDPNAPLWVDIGASRRGKAATYRAMYKSLETAARRARVAKPVTAYALRRSRLTLLAKDPRISTSILEKLAGWVPGSSVARHYVHLSGKDVIQALNAVHGVEASGEGDDVEPRRTPIKCGRCRTINAFGASYCMTCGGPLSLPAVKEIESARSSELQLAELLRKPEAIESLARLLADKKDGGSPPMAKEGRQPTVSRPGRGPPVHRPRPLPPR